MALVIQQLPRLTMQRRGFSWAGMAAASAVALGGMAAALYSAKAMAQTVVLAGRMGERALLVIDGQPTTVGVGQSASGVKLRRWLGADAEVERAGQVSLLRAGGAQANVGAAPPKASSRELVMTAGPGGHFTAGGSINGKSVRFMVDTGATLVALGRDDAVRMGIDLTGAQVAMTQTANGPVQVHIVMLSSVRVGDLELTNVGAAVVPQPMPMVLLGNSFLSRLQMRRENDVMRLERR
jgi:aspartyl protease family protein